MIPRAPDAAIQLITDLLKFRPSERISAEDALEYPYLKDFHNSSEEKDFNKDNIEMPLDDNKTYKVEAYKKELYKYIKKKNRNLKEEHEEFVLECTKYKGYGA